MQLRDLNGPNGIDPYRYLAWLFSKLPHASTADDYAALLP
ncbi:transposase domain-containing protein [Burkholderia anthina]